MPGRSFTTSPNLGYKPWYYLFWSCFLFGSVCIFLVSCDYIDAWKCQNPPEFHPSFSSWSLMICCTPPTTSWFRHLWVCSSSTVFWCCQACRLSYAPLHFSSGLGRRRSVPHMPPRQVGANWVWSTPAVWGRKLRTQLEPLTEKDCIREGRGRSKRNKSALKLPVAWTVAFLDWASAWLLKKSVVFQSSYKVILGRLFFPCIFKKCIQGGTRAWSFTVCILCWSIFSCVFEKSEFCHLCIYSLSLLCHL